MGAQNSSTWTDCCGSKIISKTDLKNTSLSLQNKSNMKIVDILKKQQNADGHDSATKHDHPNNYNKLHESNIISGQMSINSGMNASLTPRDFDSEKGKSKGDNMAISIDMNSSRLNKKLTIDDFHFIRVLGRGAFGKVVLVRKKDNGQVYALKSLKKSDIINRNHIDKAITEKTVMQSAASPFIVQLRFSFQNASNLYLVMDFLPGGELFMHLKRRGKFTEEVAKFYICEVVLALEYLHDKLDVIYRDLKPENILMDTEGHIKLTDFGLSKFTKGTSFCGTPEYLAPEILLGGEQGKGVDWWSLGCLIYEMLTGRPPFSSRNKKDLYNQILKNQPTYQSYFSDNVRDILQKLLVADPMARLGYKSTSEIKNHPYFSDVNWNNILEKKNKGPIIPNVASDIDTYNFDRMFVNQPVAETPMNRDMLFKDIAIQGFSFNYDPNALLNDSINHDNEKE